MLLIICRSKRIATARADIYRRFGLLSYGASVAESFTEMDLNYHAVIIISPETLLDPHAYVKKLRSRSPAPIFALYENHSEFPYGGAFDGTFTYRDKIPQTIHKMAECAKNRNLPYLGRYTHYQLKADVQEKSVTYFDKPIPLSKTQRRILSLLINIHPNYASPRTMVKYIYNPSKSPEPSSMRTHVHSINKIFFNEAGVHIIANIPGIGYVLRTSATVYKYNLPPDTVDLYQLDKHPDILY